MKPRVHTYAPTNKHMPKIMPYHLRKYSGTNSRYLALLVTNIHGTEIFTCLLSTNTWAKKIHVYLILVHDVPHLRLFDNTQMCITDISQNKEA